MAEARERRFGAFRMFPVRSPALCPDCALVRFDNRAMQVVRDQTAFDPAARNRASGDRRAAAHAPGGGRAAERMTVVDGPLGDVGRDRELNAAAVACFGLAGLAIVGVGIAWLVLRPAETRLIDPFASAATHDAGPVAADAPMLRAAGFGPAADSADGGPGPGALTIVDGSTGQTEVMEMSSRTAPDETVAR